MILAIQDWIISFMRQAYNITKINLEDKDRSAPSKKTKKLFLQTEEMPLIKRISLLYS